MAGSQVLNRNRWICSLFLLQAMEALGFFDRLVYGGWQGKPGDKITESLNLMLIVTSLLLVGRGFRRIKYIRTGSLLTIAAAGFLLLSSLWSIDPQTTIRRGVIYLYVVTGAIGISGCMDGDEFMDVLALTCGISGAGSVLLWLASPANAVAAGTGDFIGIFTQKNVLGQVMAAGALASLHAIRTGRGRQRSAVMLTLFVIVAVASKSATSFMTIFAMCGIDGGITLFRKGGVVRLLAIAAVSVLSPVVVLAAVFPDSLLEMMGKDPTLTGRTDLWAYVLTDIAQKPLLGWGYSAFWSPDNPAAVEISDIMRWYVPQAHNGLLEMLLSIGFVGAGFFIFLWGRNVWKALRCMRTPAKALGISTLLACIGIFLVGISETVLMEPLQITTTLFFVTGLMCEQAVRPTRRQRAIGATRLGSHMPVRV
jgi:exopolysaccharide production protein ExoQ